MAKPLPIVFSGEVCHIPSNRNAKGEIFLEIRNLMIEKN